MSGMSGQSSNAGHGPARVRSEADGWTTLRGTRTRPMSAVGMRLRISRFTRTIPCSQPHRPLKL
eukprot:14811557-Alexandrium_andersonii.AAC.1